MDQSIKIHEETYQRLRELAEEQRRPITTVIDMIVEAEWMKSHPQPISIQEELERR
jgi:predicted DNA-binding protein